MGKALFIVSLIIMIVAGGALVLGFVNVLPSQQFQDPNESATFSGSQTTISLFTGNQVAYNPIYNEIKVELFLIASSDAELTITVFIEENTGSSLNIDKNVQVFADNQVNIVFSIYAVDVFPALLGPSYKLTGDSINVDLLVTKTDGGSVSVSYVAKASLYWKIFIPISILLTMVGVVALIIAFATKSRGPKVGKPLKYQAAVFEPTLSESSQQFGGRSSSSKKIKDKKAKQSKSNKRTRGPQVTSSADRCKQCSKPVPKQAQYCPHCYARQ
ncbi:MAG: hypothetical protein HeimC3_12300 [Candidatus Heimdallarchaeota archaeon LC_3]|nr:MAG: hypothetical protein HeimC3_12300 [Candidatus Heimdallarchaeota archaeon LC_3]